MKSFKYTINGNVYKVHISSVVDDIAEVEVNGTPYQVKMEKPAKKQMVTLKRPVNDLVVFGIIHLFYIKRS